MWTQDTTTDYRLEKVYPPLAESWSLVAKDMWDQEQRQLRVTDGMRSFSAQWDIWMKGRIKGPNGVWNIVDPAQVLTYATPGESWHNYGLALDSCFLGDDPYLSKLEPTESERLWNLYGKLCQDHGLIWGGSWKIPDRPHCELPVGLSISGAQIEFENGGMPGLWKKCMTIKNSN